MNPILVTSGEPAGIGPDLCLSLAGAKQPIVVLGDKALLSRRAEQLGQTLIFDDYQIGVPPSNHPQHLTVLSLPCAVTPMAGVLDVCNASYVLDMLTLAAKRCVAQEFSALVTAPVHKAIINQAGHSFTGHTEFFADYCNIKTVVMMLACPAMRVALMTTHLPLRDVADALTPTLIIDVMTTLHAALIRDFGLTHPKIYLAGLNPHAGEGGYLGQEENQVIIPALNLLRTRGIDIQGPLPADTMFTPYHATTCDAFVAMYHDQGLPVLKYAGFGEAVNVTLGLPIIRTSVDHGTAIDLAGRGIAKADSLLAAVEMAFEMVNRHEHH